MRPLSLALEGFGSYRRRQVLTFDSLDKLFVICGETGAGKTTLFDGLCYALYGCPLGTRTKDRVRCDQCTEDENTVVELTFETGGQVWRVTRAPYFLRPMKGGRTGTTNEPFVRLVRLDAAGEVAETVGGTATKINKHIAEKLLLLTFENFSKILVLPQGEFQRFLEQASVDRGEILEKLFPVGLHKAMVVEAKRAAALRGKELAIKRQRVEDQLDRLFPEETRQGLTETEVRARVDEHHAALMQGVDVLRGDEQKASAAAEVAASSLAAAEKLQQDHVALGIARQGLHDAEAERAEMEAREDELAASRRASRCWAALEKVEELEKTRAGREDELAARRGELKSAEEDLGVLEAEHAQLPALEAELESLAGELQRNRERKKRLEDLLLAQREQEKQQAELAPAEKLVQTKQRALEGCTEASATLELHRRERDGLQPPLVRAQDAALAVSEWATTASAIAAHDETGIAEHEAGVRASATARDGLVNAWNLAQEEWLEVRARRDENVAGVLAASLEDGAPCPVCGSLEHPAQALGATSDALLEELLASHEARVTDAKAALDRHDVEAKATERSFAAVKERIERDREALLAAGFESPAAWSAAHEDCQQRLTALRERIHELDEAIQGVADEAASVEAARAAVKEAEAARAAVKEELAARTARVEQLDSALGGVADAQAASLSAQEAGQALQTAREELRERVQAIRQGWQQASTAKTRLAAEAETLARAVEELQANEGRAREDLAGILPDHGFATADELRTAYRTEEQEQELDEITTEWRARVERLQETIHKLQDAIADKDLPDLDALKEQKQQASTALQEATEARAQAEQACDQYQDERERLGKFDESWAAEKADAAGFSELKDALAGKNRKKVSFPNWVLGYWLDRVLVRANVRLRHLSEGRYALLRRNADPRGNRQAGLDIDVLDAHSGRPRDVGSLSGGEKFLASVSLALGLADVIQAQSGAVQLDTLFIDEGFGTLSDEYRELVLQTLANLRGSRQVGVISHVPEVRNFIPCRVDIRKSTDGSTIDVTG